MASQRPILLRLLREPVDEHAGAPDEPSDAQRTDVSTALHDKVRTYATGSVPRGRRIRPPSDDAPATDDAGDAEGDAAPATVPVHRIQELLEIFTRFMGPASKRVLDAHLRSLGATPQTLPVDRLPVLVKRLAWLIDTAEKKRRFLAAMTKVPGASA